MPMQPKGTKGTQPTAPPPPKPTQPKGTKGTQPGGDPNTPTSGETPPAIPPQAPAANPAIDQGGGGGPTSPVPTDAPPLLSRPRDFREAAPRDLPTFSAPARYDYGGGIPEEALSLATQLAERGRTFNDRTLESELLNFGGGDEVSSPMSRFEALRGSELQGQLTSNVLGLLHSSAEAGRGRRHEAGLQEQDLSTQRFLQQFGLAHEGEQGYLHRQHGAATQDRDLGTRRFLAGQQLGHDFDLEELRGDQRMQELLLALLGSTPSSDSSGRSGSGGVSFGL